MKQLKMIRYGGELVPRPLPDGYSIVFFSGTDEEISDCLIRVPALKISKMQF